MLLKLLHYLKDKLWKLKERKVEAVVEKIQTTTVDIVDEYYAERSSYQQALQSLSAKDLRRTVMALGITLAVCVSLVLRGSQGQGLVGPILLSFVDQVVSQTIWINQAGSGIGYYQHMVDSYVFLPNVLKYVALSVDYFLHYFYQAYFAFYPIYATFIWNYYAIYFKFLIIGLFWGN